MTEQQHDAAEHAAPCPHCPDGHDDPNVKPWAVWVTATRVDGQPPYLHVAPTAGSHVSESDAAWLRKAIRNAKHADELRAEIERLRSIHGHDFTNVHKAPVTCPCGVTYMDWIETRKNGAGA